MIQEAPGSVPGAWWAVNISQLIWLCKLKSLTRAGPSCSTFVNIIAFIWPMSPKNLCLFHLPTIITPCPSLSQNPLDSIFIRFRYPCFYDYHPLNSCFRHCLIAILFDSFFTHTASFPVQMLDCLILTLHPSFYKTGGPSDTIPPVRPEDGQQGCPSSQKVKRSMHEAMEP